MKHKGHLTVFSQVSELAAFKLIEDLKITKSKSEIELEPEPEIEPKTATETDNKKKTPKDTKNVKFSPIPLEEICKYIPSANIINYSEIGTTELSCDNKPGFKKRLIASFCYGEKTYYAVWYYLIGSCNECDNDKITKRLIDAEGTIEEKIVYIKNDLVTKIKRGHLYNSWDELDRDIFCKITLPQNEPTKPIIVSKNNKNNKKYTNNDKFIDAMNNIIKEANRNEMISLRDILGQMRVNLKPEDIQRLYLYIKRRLRDKSQEQLSKDKILDALYRNQELHLIKLHIKNFLKPIKQKFI